MLNRNQRALLERGLSQLNAYKANHSVDSRQDAINALRNLGVTPDFLSNTGGLVEKYPVVKQIANVFGVDIGKIQEDIHNLFGKATSEQSSVVGDPLQSYKDALKKLK